MSDQAQNPTLDAPAPTPAEDEPEITIERAPAGSCEGDLQENDSNHRPAQG
jgi:hypothetical protein